jgi:hypothetical protein
VSEGAENGVLKLIARARFIAPLHVRALNDSQLSIRPARAERTAHKRPANVALFAGFGTNHKNKTLSPPLDHRLVCVISS